MKYTETLASAFRVLQFKHEGVRDLQNNPNGVLHGIFTILIATVASTVGTLNPFALAGIVFNVIFAFISAGITHVLAKLFGGKAQYLEYFKVMSNTWVLSWILVIPFVAYIVAPFIGVYGIIVTIYAVKETYHITLGKAIIVVLIPIIFFIGLAGVFAVAIFSAILTGFA